MKRQLLITLVLMLCAFRSFSGTEQWRVILLPDASFDLSQSPLSACRYKKPFPFQCTQLIKKRLSNPPDSEQASIFYGHMQPATSSADALLCMNNQYWPLRQEKNKVVLLLFLATHWRSCGIERNVFHPPPFVA